MSEITENIIRIGNPTSSQIFRLCAKDKSGGKGEPFYTYVSEKKREKRLGRSININKDTRATLWGDFMEQYVHDLLPIGYEFISKKTIEHQTIKGWVGSPDNKNVTLGIVGDIKCYEPDNFTKYVDCLSEAVKTNDTEKFKKEHKKEYWQLVSNAILLGFTTIEAIVFMPFESELPTIRQMAEDYDNFDQYKFRFISESHKSELPYLPDGGYYNNLNIFRFTIPQSDIDFLTERVKDALELINEGEPKKDYSEELKKGKELRKKLTI